MESFFQRMSSIVLRNNNKEDSEEDENEKQRKFQYLQQRRRSAPDIHRRGVLNDRLVQVPDHRGTSEEQIPTYPTTMTPWRKHINAIGELCNDRYLKYEYDRFIMYSKA